MTHIVDRTPGAVELDFCGLNQDKAQSGPLRDLSALDQGTCYFTASSSQTPSTFLSVAVT